MSEPFIAEVRMTGLNFAPRGFAFCDGQLLQIAQNTALFSLIGTIYGGDGRTTTALPDLRGRAVMGAGDGAGLSSRRLGERGGVDKVFLMESQMPDHAHVLMASTSPGEQSGPNVPAGSANALGRSVGGSVYGDANNLVDLAGASLLPVGGGQQHTNQQPYLPISFVIALVGLFPSRG